MSSHLIRLRAPWKLEQAGQDQLWLRRFGRPTGLGGDERLALVVEGLAAAAELALNGRLLGAIDPATQLQEFDVSGLLLPRNQLVLRLFAVVGAGDGDNQPPCSVSLRIDWADRTG